jgi:FMN phosphatase YigB (HAD superfamily)
MGTIKVVSWDVYATLIATHYDECTDCGDIPLRARPNALEALSEIKSRGISQCTCSDGNLKNLKRSLGEVGIDWEVFFDYLYPMDPSPNVQKDFSRLIELYNIKPEEMLVIGDNYDIDIIPAREQGCRALHVPEEKEFGINPLDLEAIRKLL